eukprot:6261181-Alexandrium_andersonii.AAC.1
MCIRDRSSGQRGSACAAIAWRTCGGAARAGGRVARAYVFNPELSVQLFCACTRAALRKRE